MSRLLRVVAVSGSVQQPSRTRVLVEALLARLQQVLPVETRLVDLARSGPQFAGVLQREQLPERLREEIAAIEGADLLIAASPVYRASYTGLFKHLFDFVDHRALVGVPVLLAATGGSERHSLMIDHQLRPLFGFFQAQSLATALYASEADFSDYRIDNPALQARIELAIEHALPQLASRRPDAFSLRSHSPSETAA
ncbi:MAG: FMN reductase [Pseudomonas sp.]|uniref:FMN reductase n=1 Tax=Pseudomonas sp. TaxID=306 RepID=UPI003394C746